MNHNPHNLKEGQHVILDEDFNNANEVVIYKLTPNEMIATIYSANEVVGEMWDTMTARLSPIIKSNLAEEYKDLILKKKKTK